MDYPEIELKTRKQLRFFRWFSAYIPLKLAERIISFDSRRIQLSDDIHREPIIADGVTCEWFIPNHYDDRVILYLHGGGFVFGISGMHVRMMESLSKKMRSRVLLVDYRLAHRHPFPAALNDCVKAYQWLISEGYQPSDIFLAGDSAGGNLCITTQLLLKQIGSPLPRAAACLSPVVDLSFKVDSSINDVLLHPRAIKRFNSSYIGDDDPKNPLISPIYADCSDLSPILIHVGEEELLKDQVLRFVEKLDGSTTMIFKKIYPRMFHVWQLYPLLPQTNQSLDEIVLFFNKEFN
ncbi:MAG: alpha/beta hydrolase [Candidatus Heimdallarchaeota archaeon]|nr:alpha/beta hydrolase [Candidatus Heimdallarchaeota archaeon]